MSGRRQISIILFCLFASFVTAQSSTKTIKEVVRDGLDSIAKAHGYELHEVNILADSSARKYIDERISTNPKTILFVLHFQQLLEGKVMVRGAILPLSPPKSSESFSFVTTSTENAIHITKYELPKEEEGFWDSVLQPALVTLGAVAIVALFFLVRS